jgi:aspartate carbamoyltransferase catalytic subunit
MGANPFFDKDIVSIKDFTKDDLEYVFESTDGEGRAGQGQDAWLHILRAQYKNEDEL